MTERNQIKGRANRGEAMLRPDSVPRLDKVGTVAGNVDRTDPPSHENLASLFFMQPGRRQAC